MKDLTLLFAFSIVFTLTSLCQNNKPVAVNDTVEAISQVPIIINALSNDYDPDNDEISIWSWRSPIHGENDTINGTFYYKSHAFVGEDLFSYQLNDDGYPFLISNTGYVLININPNPNIPVAVSDEFEMVELIPYTVNLINNDYDPNNDELRIAGINEMIGCIVVLNEDSVSVTVTPMQNFLTCRFSYNVIERFTNEHYLSNYVRVNINTVSNPDIPSVMDDIASTTGGTTINIPILDNDYDLQGDSFEIWQFSQPNIGTVTREGNVLKYSSPTSFIGKETFFYNIRETIDTSIYSDIAYVYVTVNKNPDCPVGLPDNASVIAYTPFQIDVLQNDYDINGDPFELMEVSGVGNIIITNGKISYTSTYGSISKDSILYKIRQTNDTLSYSEWIPVYIQLQPNPDFPFAVDDYASTKAGIAVNIYPLVNDMKNTADSLIMISAGSVLNKGRVTFRDRNMLTYTPYYKSKGDDVIIYSIRDINNFLLNSKGTIYVTIEDQHFYDSLTISNINAGVNANGLLFSNIDELQGFGLYGGDMKSHFRFPKSGLKNTIFTCSLWVGGLNENGDLHLAGERYKQNGIDFQAGPISNVYDSAYYVKFGRTWKISKLEIDNHKLNYWKPEYQPIEAIHSWPGNGNPLLGQAQMLAPFKDLNNDGLYNPFEGDYPLIRGDQTVFFVFNDDLEHSETGGLPLGIEVHGMVYGFNEPADTALYNTVFVHYDIINRSDENYKDVYLGIFTDFDIGFALDDYIGCDVMRGSFYAYNATNQDGWGEVWSYGKNPPSQSVTILAGPFMDDDGIDNPNGGCNESINGLNFGNNIIDDERLGLSAFIKFDNSSSGNFYGVDPIDAIEYYNYFKGIWRDNTPVLYGGKGHNSFGAVGPECKYLFPGSSDPLNWGTSCNFPNNNYNQGNKFWTEDEAGNQPSDRRGVGVMGPFNFESGEVQEVELAFCAGLGSRGAMSSVNQLFMNIDSLIYYVSEGSVILPNSELGFISDSFKHKKIRIYPNPTNSTIFIDVDYPENFTDYYIYDILGALKSKGKIQKDSEVEINVSTLSPGVYIIRLVSGNNVFSGKLIKQ